MADNTTPSAGGDTYSADDIGGVKTQRVKFTLGPDGISEGDVARGNPMPAELRHRNPAYRLFVPPAAAGASKVYFDLFNATGSGKTMRVLSVVPIVSGAVAVTGIVAVDLYLTRTTAIGTGGTAAVIDGSSLTAPSIAEMDPANTAPPAGVTCRAAPTGGATASAVLSLCSVFTEETNAATYLGHFNDLARRHRDGAQALVVPENIGLRVVQGPVASVGNIGFDVLFELE